MRNFKSQVHISFAAYHVYSSSEASVCPSGSSAVNSPNRLLPPQQPVVPGVASTWFSERLAPRFFRFFFFEFDWLFGRSNSAGAQCWVALNSCSYSCFASGHRLRSPSTEAEASSWRQSPCTRLPQYSLWEEKAFCSSISSGQQEVVKKSGWSYEVTATLHSALPLEGTNSGVLGRITS